MVDFVYFAEAMGLGLVKIGRSAAPARRVLSMQLACPVPLRLVCTVPDGAQEAGFHKAMDEFRTDREWFRLDDWLLVLLSFEEPRVHWFGTFSIGRTFHADGRL